VEQYQMPPKCVLIVDDDEDSRTICREVLRHYGYRVIEACNGPDGVLLADSERPDLVIMDLRLPGQHGMELARQIREQAGSRSFPIMLYTADAIGSRQYLREDCISALLIKPCTPTAVMGEVKRLIGGPGLDGDRASA
jgi:CheY-like chemotaxis protein